MSRRLENGVLLLLAMVPVVALFAPPHDPHEEDRATEHPFGRAERQR